MVLFLWKILEPFKKIAAYVIGGITIILVFYFKGRNDKAVQMEKETYETSYKNVIERNDVEDNIRKSSDDDVDGMLSVWERDKS